MKVLLVDGSAADAAALERLLESGGHEVFVCLRGDEALCSYARLRPDLIVIDAALPDVSSLTLFHEVQKLAAPAWQPAILVSAAFDAGLLTCAMAAGCEACFPKPVDFAGFARRLEVLSRHVQMQRAVDSQLTQIRDLLAADEADLNIARHLIEHQLVPDGVRRHDDPAVQYWRRTCARLGGDMLSVSRTPSGVLHVLLADAKENGLSAYVSLLPIVSPFYRMTEKGFPLATIVRELNRKVRQTLPLERQVAVQLATVDRREGIVGIWNGGMPTAFMLDGFGHHFQEFALRHAPLGMLPDDDFDERIEQHAFTPGEQLVMVTDGLLECAGANGRRFGEQGLADALIGQPRSKRRMEAIASIEAHLGDLGPQDDMTFVLIDCEREADASVQPEQKMANAGKPGSWFFEIRLGASELCRLDVVPLLLHVVGQFHLGGDCSGKLFIILSELFNNALDHGVLRLDSRLKQSPDGMEAWLLMREERLAALLEGEVRLSVEQFVETGRLWLRLVCQDSGHGFNVGEVLTRVNRHHAQGCPDLLPFGRGLLLLQNLADSINYSGSGNTVTVLMEIEGGHAIAH